MSLQLAIMSAAFSMRVLAGCPGVSDIQPTNRLSYVHTLLSSSANLDNNLESPETPKDASGFEKLMNIMLEYKQLAAKLGCAREAVHPFTASPDAAIAKAAAHAERLYTDEIAVTEEALDLMKSDAGTLSGPLADKISSIQIKNRTFWSDMVSMIGVDTPGLLFTDGKDEKGVHNALRITVPEHIELSKWLFTAPEFAYQRSKDPRSRGALMGFQFFVIVLNGRPLLHSDGQMFPVKETFSDFMKAQQTAHSESTDIGTPPRDK